MGLHLKLNPLCLKTAERVLFDVAQGETVTAVLRRYGLQRTCWKRWTQEVPSLSDRMAEAVESSWDAIAQECLDIADGERRKADLEAMDLMTQQERRIAERLLVMQGDATQRDKLKIDTRLKLLGKWSARYGDKSTVEHKSLDAGGDPRVLLGGVLAALKEARRADMALPAPSDVIDADYSEVATGKDFI